MPLARLHPQDEEKMLLEEEKTRYQPYRILGLR